MSFIKISQQTTYEIPKDILENMMLKEIGNYDNPDVRIMIEPLYDTEDNFVSMRVVVQSNGDM